MSSSRAPSTTILHGALDAAPDVAGHLGITGEAGQRVEGAVLHGVLDLAAHGVAAAGEFGEAAQQAQGVAEQIVEGGVQALLQRVDLAQEVGQPGQDRAGQVLDLLHPGIDRPLDVGNDIGEQRQQRRRHPRQQPVNEPDEIAGDLLAQELRQRDGSLAIADHAGGLQQVQGRRPGIRRHGVDHLVHQLAHARPPLVGHGTEGLGTDLEGFPDQVGHEGAIESRQSSQDRARCRSGAIEAAARCRNSVCMC